MTDHLLMEHDVENGRIVIRLRGEIDLSNVEGLESQIDRAITDVHNVVIDLTAIEFIDSRGLRLLKRLATDVSERNATFAVVAPPKSIARSVLEMTHMTDELGVRDSPDSPEPTN
jgi:anti-anti-sigma factor